MTLEQRITKLCDILCDGIGRFKYEKSIPRLRFKIMGVRKTDKELYFCMYMGHGEINVLEISDLNVDELAEIVLDLEKMLIND